MTSPDHTIYSYYNYYKTERYLVSEVHCYPVVNQHFGCLICSSPAPLKETLAMVYTYYY